MLKDERIKNSSGLRTLLVIAVTRLFSAETWDAINRAVVALIISMCTLGVASQQAAAQVYVQGNAAVPQTPQPTVTVPYNAAQTAGNLNLVIVGWNDTTAQVSSVTDTKGNPYVLATVPIKVAGALTQSIYYAKNIAAAAAGANVVKVTFSTAAVFPDIRVSEYSGLDTTSPLDVAIGASGSSTTSSSGPVTTTNARDLLVGANTVWSHTAGAGPGFTQRMLTSPDGDIAEDQVVSTVGSYTATAPLSYAAAWVMQMVAFKASGGGTGGTIPSVTASGATNVTATTATLNGSIVSTGNQPIMSDGFEYGLDTNYGTPVAATTVTSGAFSANITGLTSGKTYHYRAKATNASGTGVSSDSQFQFGGGNTGAQVTGKWQTLPYPMPVNPIRVGLLHTGQIVIITGSENNPSEHSAGISVGALWDLKVPSITVIPMLWDVFCNGGSFLADGRCMAFGGTDQYDYPTPGSFAGDPRTTVFDPSTDLFTQLQDMSAGRWYATSITLGDGRVMVFSGSDSTGATNQNVEFYTVGTGYSAPYKANWVPPLYPWLHLLPNGMVFYSGYTPTSWMFNPTNTSWTPSASSPTNFNRLYGSSVLLPLLPPNYTPRVMVLGGSMVGTTGSTSTDTTEIIDLSKTTPAWVSSGSMPSGARMEGNTVLLPTGKLLAQGGSLVDEDASTATLGADLFDPNTLTWSSAGRATYPRLYHSIALLLPDATVVTAGSNPARGTYDQHIEVYSPAYLFTTDANGNTIPATRPTISSAPAKIGYASNFQVQTPNAANISSVVLIRAGSDTHAFDMDQRLVGLTFTAGAGVLNVTGPPNQNIAPPGYYMLFLVNTAGVPSVAPFVQLSNFPTDQPPKGLISSPTGNLTVDVNQPVNFAGTATDADGTVAKQQWIFPEGNPATSLSLNAGSVLFPEPGTYVASLTAVDNLGVNDPSPPTRTITVRTGTGGGGTPRYVQSNSATPQTPQTTVTVQYNAAQTAGNLNLVVVGWSDTTAKISAVTDTLGNSYILAKATTLNGNGGPLSQSMYYARNIGGATAGANVVKVTFTSAAVFPDIQVLEYSGLNSVNPLDVAVGASGNSAMSSSGSVTTSSATEVLVAANTVWSHTAGAGPGFTQRLLTSPDGDIAEDQVVLTLGTYTATAPLSYAGGWIMQTVALRP